MIADFCVFQVEIVGRAECGAAWGVDVHASQVCAAGGEEGGGVCQGDSGGPLVTKTGGVWEVGAVVSSGSSVCGDSNPTFFALINKQIFNWIVKNMKDDLSKRPSN